jgi:hypothetical protein
MFKPRTLFRVEYGIESLRNDIGKLEDGYGVHILESETWQCHVSTLTFNITQKASQGFVPTGIYAAQAGN